MIVCGIDCETTGLDIKKDRITEIGAVLFDASKNWAKLETMNFFVYEPDYAPLSEEIVQITGITDEILKTQGLPFSTVHSALMRFTTGVGCFMAHNAAFDKGILDSECARQGREKFDKDWICTALDLKSNRQFKSWRLAHLALDYGVTVNPKLLHRAVNDVELMGQMLAEAKADVHSMIKFMLTPNIVVQACIPAPWTDGGKGKEAAQKRGYFWERPKYSDETFAKMWVKVLKEDEYEAELKEAPFETKRIK